MQQKTEDNIVALEVNRIEKLLCLTDQLTEKAQKAITELDMHIVTNRTKKKVIEYRDNKAIGKPTKETIYEKEEKLAVATTIDRLGLQQVSATLKNIKDILITQQDNQGVKVVQIIDDIPKETN